MNYHGQTTPADPFISQSSDPSSPPSLEEPQHGVTSAFQSSSTGIPRFPQVKLRIKLGRETPNSAPQIMESSVAYKYNNGGNDSDDEPPRDYSNFSGVNAKAVRERLRKEAEEEAAAANGSEANGSEAASNTNADNESTDAQVTPKKELRERKKASPLSPSPKKSSKKGRKSGRGRKPKATKKDEGEDGDAEEKEEEGGEEDGEEPEEEYEVERILSHGWSEDGDLIYKVKWVGYGPEFDTFEPASGLDSAKLKIEEYKRSLPVESRAELDGKKKGGSKKRGRPSNGSKAGKKPRRSTSKMTSDDESASEKDDDDDFKLEKSGGGGASTSRSRGRPPKSKGELKLFERPKQTGPPKKKPFMATRQGWLESGSDSDSETEGGEEKKDKKKRISESPAPKRDTGRKRAVSGKEAEADTPTTAANGGRASRGAAASSAAIVEGMYRYDNGEVDVMLSDGRGVQRVVTLREAHDEVGYALISFLADRFNFRA